MKSDVSRFVALAMVMAIFWTPWMVLAEDQPHPASEIQFYVH